MSLSACNPDRGPEYTTPAEFGEVTVSPQTMAFDSEVRVKVSVSCPYGLRNVCILYMLDGDESDVRTVWDGLLKRLAADGQLCCGR